MRILLTTILGLIAITATAQTVVTIDREVAVKVHPNENSETIRELPKGYMLHLTGQQKDTWRQTNLGWVRGSSLLVVRPESMEQLETSGENWYTQQLLAKNPSDLTSNEIQYLMYAEKQKDEQLRKDIRFFRNTTIVGIIVSAATTIASGIILSNQ